MNGTFHSKFGSLVGVLYVGHSNCRFLVYAAKNAEVLTCHEERLEVNSPHSGWVEFDPMQIWQAARESLERAVQNLVLLDIDPRDILAIGICNQRETSVLWDKGTGLPLCNAIGWCDTRTSGLVKELLVRVRGKINFLKEVCGLPFANCFSAVKIRWMLDHLGEEVVSGKELSFGTLDSWIMWNLTGGINGGIHMTDVTNASRTMLMNLRTQQWDSRLCHFFKIPQNILPQIRSCSEVYGYVIEGPLSGIPIAGCIGDQQAALLGQICLSAGQLSCNLDEGCFVLFNTAQEIIDSDNGLLSTIAFKLGPKAETFYALEGAIPHAGSSIGWMHENLQLPNDSNHNGSLTQSFREEPTLFSSVCSMNSSFGGYPSEARNFNPNYEVILVPAFSGYYTPYWRYKVRGVLFGLTLQTSARQILFAAYEAVCFQVREVLDSLAKDCKTWPAVTKFVAGGDLSEKPFLMQMLADLSGVSIERPQSSTPACLGTMLAAGLAADVLTLDEFRSSCIPPIDYYSSTHYSSQRDMKFRKWKIAVDRCLNFESVSETDLSKFRQEEIDPEYSVLCSIPGGVYVISSFVIIILAQFLQQNRSA
ncbi:glycerol kinase [Toxorhynchites rutilus septentrionalis]|uniref:glycerol kinase n=1 Tax=Toxorhynchites rutilus septentrionalis TaxID=329112 RepID=UPI00247AA6C7|nr:glycerol kinase [Toxorhynchites rutilus septentrionalis]